MEFEFCLDGLFLIFNGQGEGFEHGIGWKYETFSCIMIEEDKQFSKMCN